MSHIFSSLGLNPSPNPKLVPLRPIKPSLKTLGLKSDPKFKQKTHAALSTTLSQLSLRLSRLTWNLVDSY